MLHSKLLHISISIKEHYSWDNIWTRLLSSITVFGVRIRPLILVNLDWGLTYQTVEWRWPGYAPIACHPPKGISILVIHSPISFASGPVKFSISTSVGTIAPAGSA